MISASSRSQFLDFNLTRSGFLTPVEHALLNVIMSFSDHCQMNQAYLAKAINRSVRTVQRTIRSLIEKGMIDRTYTVFKRCFIRIRSLKAQAELMTASGIIKQALKVKNSRMKSSHTTKVSRLYLPSMSEPTRSKTQEIKTGRNFLNLTNEMPKSERRMSEGEFNNTRSQQLLAFAERFGLKI